MTKEALIKEVKDIYIRRGLRMSKDLLDLEYKLLLSEIDLEKKLKGNSFIKLHDDLRDLWLEFIEATQKYCFTQGYLVANGYEDGLRTLPEDNVSAPVANVIAK